MTSEERNREVHRRFVTAWTEGEVNRLMACVTDDIVYGASVGPEPGATYTGKDAVAQGFRAIMAHDRGATMSTASATFLEDRAFVEWISSGVGGEIRGIDVLVFRDGLIARKDAYRKSRA
ncbi:MAG: nuclear transport factor 2 family protein [Micropepsaceae bacterium]